MRIRTYHELEGGDASDLGGQVRQQMEKVAHRLRDVRHVVAVMSGKGGVGKSLVAVAMAAAAGAAGRAVALLDADLNGPTAARMLGVADRPLRIEAGAVVPPEGGEGVAVMSMALLLEEGAPLEWREPDAESFVWRGAQERGALREFLADVAWGRRDLLVVDLPPGPQRLVELAELVPGLAGAVAVTVPSSASRDSVERSLALCRQRGIPLLGIVENMSGYRCSGCGRRGPLFPGSAGEELAEAFQVPLLARVPFDPEAGACAESGDPIRLLSTAAGASVTEAAAAVSERLEMT